MVYIVVFLLSFASLSLEILLARVFSVNQWNHLSFMVISIALFGFAAGGTYLSLLDAVNKDWGKRLISINAMALAVLSYAAGVMVSFLVVNRLPLDYFRLPLEPTQTFYLLTAYLLFTFPFFCAGLVMSAAYARLPEKTGYLYATAMFGSAGGAALPAFLLQHMDEGSLIIWTAAAPVALFWVAAVVRADHRAALRQLSRVRQAILLAATIAVLLTGIYLVTPNAARFIRVMPSPYKALRQALLLPDSNIIDTRYGIRGRSDTLASPFIRYAPGLSLKYTGRLPRQQAVFRDGDHRFVFYENLTRGNSVFATHTLSFAGYTLAPEASTVLIIQNGGGLGIACAIAASARQITVLEQNPVLAGKIRKHYGLPVVNRNFRAYLAESNRKYDVIHIENRGTSLPGSAALSQEYFFTLDTLKICLEHLTENGVIIITRQLLLPPSDSLRQWATVFETLRAAGTGKPGQHIAILRNWDTYTLVFSRRSLDWAGDLKSIARHRNVDIVYGADIEPEQANRYAVFDAPFHFLEIDRLRQAYHTGREKEYFRSYPLDVRPQTDDRPFPARMIKWSRLHEIYKSTGSRFYTMLMSGEIVVATVLLEALGISIFLLALPVLISHRQRRRPTFSRIGYFFSVGAGFMFIEMYFIKQFVLLFGDPVISLSVVLSGMLVFSGIGGFVSQRVRLPVLRPALVCLIMVLSVLIAGLHGLIQYTLTLPNILQYGVSYLVMAPAGILAGLPFPVGMRELLSTSFERTYAWTANGCTSVVTSIVAAQLALSLGITSIVCGAVLSYSMVLMLALKIRPKPL